MHGRSRELLAWQTVSPIELAKVEDLLQTRTGKLFETGRIMELLDTSIFSCVVSNKTYARLAQGQFKVNFLAYDWYVLNFLLACRECGIFTAVFRPPCEVSFRPQIWKNFAEQYVLHFVDHSVEHELSSEDEISKGRLC